MTKAIFDSVKWLTTHLATSYYWNMHRRTCALFSYVPILQVWSSQLISGRETRHFLIFRLRNKLVLVRWSLISGSMRSLKTNTENITIKLYWISFGMIPVDLDIRSKVVLNLHQKLYKMKLGTFHEKIDFLSLIFRFWNLKSESVLRASFRLSNLEKFKYLGTTVKGFSNFKSYAA